MNAGAEAAREAFQRSEERAFADHGLTVTPRFLELRQPAMRARVLEAGSGAPVVLIHGGGGFASNWLPLMARMPDWRSIAVDRPGCGLSDGFDYSDHRGIGLRRHAVEFIGSLLDVLGLERAPLVANSMGGLWALHFALAHPERVSALCLLGCPALFPGTGAPLPLRLFSIGPLRALLMRLVRRRPAAFDARSGLRRMLGRQAVDAMSEAELDCVRLAQEIPGAMAAFQSLLGSVFLAGIARPGVAVSAAELRRVETPTLLVWGSDDPFGSIAAVEQSVSTMPDARLEVVDGGHQPWSSQPERCAELVSSFLASAGGTVG